MISFALGASMDIVARRASTLGAVLDTNAGSHVSRARSFCDGEKGFNG